MKLTHHSDISDLSIRPTNPMDYLMGIGWRCNSLFIGGDNERELGSGLDWLYRHVGFSAGDGNNFVNNK